jgi:hypothetical protein
MVITKSLVDAGIHGAGKLASRTKPGKWRSGRTSHINLHKLNKVQLLADY